MIRWAGSRRAAPWVSKRAIFRRGYSLVLVATPVRLSSTRSPNLLLLPPCCENIRHEKQMPDRQSLESSEDELSIERACGIGLVH